MDVYEIELEVIGGQYAYTITFNGERLALDRQTFESYQEAVQSATFVIDCHAVKLAEGVGE